MAKVSYKIPTGLDANHLDLEISLKGKDGVGLKPISIKVLLTYLLSAVVCFFVCTKTFIHNGSMLQIVLFIICWVILTILLVSNDKTHRMRFWSIASLLHYLPKGARKVDTKRADFAQPFYQIAGIRSIENNKSNIGLVEYVDGSFAFWYRVVGSASILLFESDRDAIIERVDSYYRKVQTDCETIFITTKEPQKVYRQLASLKRRYDSLVESGYYDKDLLNLMENQRNVLADTIGQEYKSIHQYMIIKCDNKDALLASRNVLQSEVENSSRMIKQCVPLSANDIEAVLRTVYKGV